MVAIIVLVVLIGGIVWFQSARDKRKRSGTTATVLTATVNRPADAVQEQFSRSMPARTAMPKGIKSSLYLSESRPGRLIYIYDSSLGEFSFESTVTFDGDGDTTVVRQVFTRWMNSNGMLAKPRALKAMRADVEQTLRHIDPTVAVRQERV